MSVQPLTSSGRWLRVTTRFGTHLTASLSSNLNAYLQPNIKVRGECSHHINYFSTYHCGGPLRRSRMNCGVKLHPHSGYMALQYPAHDIPAILPTSRFQPTMGEKRGNYISSLDFAWLEAATPKLFYKLCPSSLGISSCLCLRTSFLRYRVWLRIPLQR